MSEQGYELIVKLRRIVLPTLTLSVSMLCGYSSFNYPLVARHLGPFFEAYLGSELSGNELRGRVSDRNGLT